MIGSANLDIVVAVDRFPAPGETVLGGNLIEIAGGKGLNQASPPPAAASTALVGCVGEDSAGQMLVSPDWGRRGWTSVTSAASRRRRGGRSSRSPPDGENSIVVAAAANAELTI